MTLGELIRKRRKELGLPLRAVGKKSGLSSMFLCDIEYGWRNPSEEALGRIATALKAWTIDKIETCRHCGGSGTQEGKTITWKPSRPERGEGGR